MSDEQETRIVRMILLDFMGFLHEKNKIESMSLFQANALIKEFIEEND